MYLIEEVIVGTTKVVGHYHFVLVLLKVDFIEGGFHSLHNHWEILSPFDLSLCLRSVGVIDEEYLVVLQSLSMLKGFPDLVVVGPSLQEYDDVLALMVAIQKILQRFLLGHATLSNILIN